MTKKIGILGGGQLGRMFLQEAANYPYEYHFLDAENAPCQSLTEHFQVGDFNDYETVMVFAAPLDVIGIEIEHVNVEALKDLAAQGKTVIPAPATLATIKDKGLQKQFYETHQIKTPDFYLIECAADIDTTRIDFPFVQKLRTGGYDGKGVQVIRSTEDLADLWDEPSVIEVFTPIAKEIAVMVIRDLSGQTVVYPCVEMVFDPELNLVDYLVSPANISALHSQQATELAEKVVGSLGSAGVFAVELFIDEAGELWVNETAPRVHNSGHHTIEAAYCSQFAQMLRVLADLPLGNSSLRERGAMINLVGAPDSQGKAVINGIETLAALPNTYLHWYGKTTTSPGRKMGHITILGSADEINRTITTIKSDISVVSE